MNKDTMVTRFKKGMRVIVKDSHDDNGLEGVLTRRFSPHTFFGGDEAWYVEFDDNREVAHYIRKLKPIQTSWKKRYGGDK